METRGLSSEAILKRHAAREIGWRNLFTIDFNRTGEHRCAEDILGIPVKTAVELRAEAMTAARPHREILSMESLKNKLWGQGQVIFGAQRRAREKAEQERRNREAHRELFPMEFND